MGKLCFTIVNSECALVVIGFYCYHSGKWHGWWISYFFSSQGFKISWNYQEGKMFQMIASLSCKALTCINVQLGSLLIPNVSNSEMGKWATYCKDVLVPVPLHSIIWPISDFLLGFWVRDIRIILPRCSIGGDCGCVWEGAHNGGTHQVCTQGGHSYQCQCSLRNLHKQKNQFDGNPFLQHNYI